MNADDKPSLPTYPAVGIDNSFGFCGAKIPKLFFSPFNKPDSLRNQLAGSNVSFLFERGYTVILSKQFLCGLHTAPRDENNYSLRSLMLKRCTKEIADRTYRKYVVVDLGTDLLCYCPDDEYDVGELDITKSVDYIPYGTYQKDTESSASLCVFVQSSQYCVQIDKVLSRKDVSHLFCFSSAPCLHGRAYNRTSTDILCANAMYGWASSVPGLLERRGRSVPLGGDSSAHVCFLGMFKNPTMLGAPCWCFIFKQQPFSLNYTPMEEYFNDWL